MATQVTPADYFTLFGIERKLALDLDDLQRRFYRLSREWHPDVHARSGGGQRELAERTTAMLNDGWRILRDPVSRAEYVLKADGFDIGEQRGKDVPPELLEEVFDLNMALEEAREGDAEAASQVRTALEKFEALLGEADRERDTLFAEHDAGGGRNSLTKLRAVLNRRKYLQNLVRDARSAIA